jgi:alpha-glucuronidase
VARIPPVNSAAVFPGDVPDPVVTLGHSALEDSASRELIRGWRGILQREPHIVTGASSRLKRAVVIGTEDEINAWYPSPNDHKPLATEAYKLYSLGDILVVEGGGQRGVLYEAVALLHLIAEEHSLAILSESSNPGASVRWTNEWDNPYASIERGYAGPSIFFEGGKVRADLSRAATYARLLSSIGVNGLHDQ